MKKNLRYFKIYAVCIIIAITLLFALNFILQLPAITCVIGDENTWLPIISDAVVTSLIFIAGNSIANEDRRRAIYEGKKKDFENVQCRVNAVITALDIRRKQLYIINSLDVTISVRDKLTDILNLQENISSSIRDFEQVKYLITSQKELIEFVKDYSALNESFQIVFDGLAEIVNDWADLQSKMAQSETMHNYSSHENNYVGNRSMMIYRNNCKKLEEEKESFKKLYNNKKKQLDGLIKAVNTSANNLLSAETNILKKLEI